MSEFKTKIHDNASGFYCVLAGDYYIPAIGLPENDNRPIGKWGRMHPGVSGANEPATAQPFDSDGKLHTYLTDLNEQAQERCQLIIWQLARAEGVNEDLKRYSQCKWIQAMT